MGNLGPSERHAQTRPLATQVPQSKIDESHKILRSGSSMAFPLTRRNFIRTSSAFLALPWLESLASGADAGPPPKRMVNVCTSFGLYGPSFFPEKSGADYVPSEYMEILKDMRDQFTVFSGISHPEIGGDHASEACFLTSAKHPTKGGFRNTI